jgi:hypothetical protein
MRENIEQQFLKVKKRNEELRERPVIQKAANDFLEGFFPDSPLYERGKLEPVEVALDFGKRLQALETALSNYTELSLSEREAIIKRLDQFLQGASLVNRYLPESKTDYYSYVKGMVRQYVPKEDLRQRRKIH